MTDRIFLMRIEKQRLVGFADRIVPAEMPNEKAAIGKHNCGERSGFQSAFVPACAVAGDITQGKKLGMKQVLLDNFGHSDSLAPSAAATLPLSTSLDEDQLPG